MIEKVKLTITQLIENLNSGLSWLKKDDNGAGSIQQKYEATDIQILTIQKHPALKDVQVTKYIFEIVDDTKATEDVEEKVCDNQVVIPEQPTPPSLRMVKEGELLQKGPGIYLHSAEVEQQLP